MFKHDLAKREVYPSAGNGREVPTELFFQKRTSPRVSCVQMRSCQGISLSKRIIAKAEVHLHAESSVTRVFGFRIESTGRLHVTDSGGVFCFPMKAGIDPQHGIPGKIVRRENKSS